MSKEQPSATTRRAFLGTATVATAASLTGPMAAADQSTDRPDPAGHHQTSGSECGCARTAGGARQSRRLDQACGHGHSQRRVFQA